MSEKILFSCKVNGEPFSRYSQGPARTTIIIMTISAVTVLLLSGSFRKYRMTTSAATRPVMYKTI